MAKPITSKRFLELCKTWNIKATPIRSSWATHNRNHKGEWSDLNGVMLHHTGRFTSVASMCDLLWDGYEGLPGPLCQAGIDPAGILRLAGWGRANHAGLGSSTVLEAVKDSKLPRTGSLKPGTAKVDGNAHFYGFEIFADGQTPMTEAQRITAIRVSALLCREHGWKADVIGHGEWQQGKWDPGAHGKLVNMGQFRTWIDQAILEGPPKPLPARPATPKPRTKTITVVKGDTLLGLAKKYYGPESDKWVEIVDDNPQLLQPGMKLTVPNK